MWLLAELQAVRRPAPRRRRCCPRAAAPAERPTAAAPAASRRREQPADSLPGGRRDRAPPSPARTRLSTVGQRPAGPSGGRGPRAPQSDSVTLTRPLLPAPCLIETTAT